ncbi:vWA domain-containing protein [Leucobacter albus]|uniref:VWA domain-containing protein n=1 Tax=Leucobacter albus TaxID=272210 RepID=A0ABW3TQ90_9MICO
MRPGEASPEPRLATHLAAAGRLLGVRLTLVDGCEWQFEAGGVRVGAHYFASRGHDDREATALTLRELWLPAGGGNSQGRELRRSRILAARPDLATLLITVDRLQSQRLLLSAMPGQLDPLIAATGRGIPADLLEWSPAAQWLGLLLRASLGLDTVAAAPVAEQFTPEVRLALAGSAGPEAVAAFDRLLAAVLPGYLALASGSGLAEQGAAGAAAGPENGEAAAIDLGAGDRAEGAGATEAEEGADADASGDAEAPREPELGGDEPEQPDIEAAASIDADAAVETNSSKFPSVLSDTPVPAERPRGAGLLAAPSLDAPSAEPPAISSTEPGTSEAPTRRWAPADGGASLAEYRYRLRGHGAEVRAVREVWRRLLQAQLRTRQRDARRASPEAGTLHTERLAATVAEARGGNPRPHAYRGRRAVVQPGPGLGRTDYLLVLDRSGSMQGGAAQLCADAGMVFLEALEAAARDIRDIDARHRVRSASLVRSGLIVFDREPAVVKRCAERLTDGHRAALRHTVSAAEGETNLRLALELAERELRVAKREGAGATVPVHRATPGRGAPRRVLVCISDGGFSSQAHDAEATAAAASIARLRRDGVDTWGIGIGGLGGMELFAPHAQSIASLRQLPDAIARLLVDTARRG